MEQLSALGCLMNKAQSATMRITALPTIFTCSALAALTLICNAQPKPPNPQGSKIGDIRFHLVMRGKLGIKGGGSGDVSDYKTDDGTRLRMRIESWRSADQVHDAMQRLTNQAIRFVDTHPKLNETGHIIGQRAVFLVPIGHAKTSLAVVAWIQERNLYVIESPKLNELCFSL
jgi:hypothetical protein